MEPKFEPLILNHLLGSCLYYVSLLSNAHVFEVLETNAHLSIQMRRKLASGVHVKAQFVMVPEYLVLLVKGWYDSIVFARLLEVRIKHLPTWFKIDSLIFVQF